MPWVVLAVFLLVVCWRRLPGCYTVFWAAVLAVAVAGSNLDSFERYALGAAFPLTIAAALVCGKPGGRAGRPGAAPGRPGGLCPSLAFLNIAVP